VSHHRKLQSQAVYVFTAVRKWNLTYS